MVQMSSAATNSSKRAKQRVRFLLVIAPSVLLASFSFGYAYQFIASCTKEEHLVEIIIENRTSPADDKNVIISTEGKQNSSGSDRNESVFSEEKRNLSDDKETKIARRRLEFVHVTKTGGSAIEKVGASAGLIWGACHYMNISDVGCYGADIPYVAPNYQSYALTSPWHAPPKVLQTRVNSTKNPFADADLFTVVRNPYDRAVSEYHCPWVGYKGKKPNDPEVMNKWIYNMVQKVEQVLKEYNKQKPEDRPKEQGKGLNEDPYVLAQKHFINQYEYVYDGDKKIIEHVLHYENMSEEFGELMKKYELDLSLPDKKNSGVYTKHGDKLTYRDLRPYVIKLINRYAAPDFEHFGYEMVESFEDDEKQIKI